jgi:hypothetical protein
VAPLTHIQSHIARCPSDFSVDVAEEALDRDPFSAAAAAGTEEAPPDMTQSGSLAPELLVVCQLDPHHMAPRRSMGHPPLNLETVAILRPFFMTNLQGSFEALSLAIFELA